MKRHDIINTLIVKYELTSYLEIGVRSGACFNQIRCKNKESIDPYHNATYMVTSDVFFAANKKKYDIIFIDGMHEEHQVFRDIVNSLGALKKGGFVVLHDCNPPTPEYTKKTLNGTVYKGFIKAKQNLDNHNCFTVDADHGCGIITKRKLKRAFTSAKGFFDWNDFNENRNELLDLIKPKELYDIL